MLKVANNPLINGKGAGQANGTPGRRCRREARRATAGGPDAARAIEFYGTVFGAALVSRTDGPDGSVPHAELDFGTGRLQLGDPSPKLGLTAPELTGNVSHSTMIYCGDIDAAYQRAINAGATSIEEPATFVTGDRFGVVMDPFGHRWAIMTRVEDVPAEEAERRVQEWLASQAG